MTKGSRTYDKVRIEEISDFEKENPWNNASESHSNDFHDRLGYEGMARTSAVQMKTWKTVKTIISNYRDKKEKGDHKITKERFRKHKHDLFWDFLRRKITIICNIIL